MAHIKFSNVGIRYSVYSSGRQRSILSYAANRASFGRLAREAGDIPAVDALDGLSFELKDGDRLALFGRNGSGKTTTLKVCAGLLLPSFGKIEIEGSRASIFSAGAGFDLDKSGAENVDSVGRLLGVSRGARKLLLDDVADFTELGDYLYLPMRTYSTGMMVRLMFAVATSVERDILIVDEVIGTGDAHFVQKAAARVRSMFARARVLVLATHSGDIAAQLCNRAIWMHAGRAVMAGSPAAVWDAYLHQRFPQPASRLGQIMASEESPRD